MGNHKRGAVPKRIQRKRTKGWKMPDGAVIVTRPGFWGNPFTQPTRQAAVDLYQAWITGSTISDKAHRARLNELRGKDLVCWCPMDQPCHADVLLKLANE